MNHVYRIIWSRVRNAFVVVSELARGHGNGRRTGRLTPAVRGVFVLSALSTVLWMQSVAASGVETAGGNTRVYNAPNGVQVIDIATVNGAGVSHNRFVHYNVGPDGQVLNNHAARNGGTVQSQLAGQLVPNLNLNHEASLILNEVTAPNRSQLLGYTEVVGGRADVIVANPYGITCSGCGFINTDRATLTTGTPVFGANGALTALEVRQGDVLIDGQGLDGRNQRLIDLVARNIRVEGRIRSEELALVAGRNDYDHAGREARAVAGDGGDAPLYAIDSTALGGMYAQRVMLLATEHGVGVRMRGEAAASGDDFTLTASGRIEIHGQASAVRDLRITYSGHAADAAALAAVEAGAELSAGRDLRITLGEGGMTLGEARLTAERDVIVTAASLDDRATGVTRFAERNLQVILDGAAAIDGSVWGAGTLFQLAAGSMAVGEGAELYSRGTQSGSLRLNARSGDLRLLDAELQSAGGLRLESALDLILAADARLRAAGAADLVALRDIHHAGDLQAARAVAFNATRDILVTAEGRVQADAALALHAQQDLRVAGDLQAGAGLLLNVGSDIDIDATGNLQAQEAARVVAGGDIHHAGRLQAGGATEWTAAGAMSTADGSRVTAQLDMTMAADSDLDLAGELQAGGGMTLSAGEAAHIRATASLQAGGAARVAAGQGGLHHAGSLRTAAGVQLASAAAITTLAGSLVQADAAIRADADAAMDLAGAWLSDDDITIEAGGDLATATTADINAGGHLGVTVAGAVQHAGTLQTTGELTLASGGALTTMNGASLRAGGGVDIGVGGDFTHGGVLIGIGGSEIRAQGRLQNNNLMHGAESLSISARGIGVGASAGISSLGDLILTATQSSDIDNHGALYAGESLALTATGGDIFNRRTGTLDSSGRFDSRSRDFTNNGAVVIVGDADIRTTRAFVNQTLDQNGNEIRKAISDTVIESEILTNDKIANSGFWGGMNAWLYDERFVREEYFIGLTAQQVNALPKAQIIVNGSGGSLNINYGNSGRNAGGVLSAPNLTITGTGTFTNQDLVLHRYSMVRRWIYMSGADFVWVRTDPERYCYDGAPANCSGRNDNLPNSPDDDDYEWYSWPGPGQGWARAYGDHLADATQGAILEGATVIASTGAGIYASSFTFNGGTLKNEGSPWPDDRSKVNQGTPRSGQSNAPGSQSANIGSRGSNNLNLDLDLSLVLGVSLTLPTNPNGYYVIAKDPTSRYLVETNPLFGVGSQFVGSDYLAERYGYNPDTVQTRLGDANYEAHLIRQQLIQQTGSNLIRGQENEAAQMQQLMDQAYAQGRALGLEFGKALSPEQIAGLTQDIVWMETVIVDGREVLAPKVYLAPTTIAGLGGGAVIAADQTMIAGDGLENVGGTIEGSDSLAVQTTGDIRNVGGTLRGGDVSLGSSEGSVINETLAIGAGDGTTYVTAIGRTGGIEATGDLAIDAAQDITVRGANVSAGGDAALSAGGDVTFDTVVDKSTSTSHSGGGGLLGSRERRVSETTETHIGSGLTVGGNLRIDSGGDTVIAGSEARVGGDLDVETGGDFRLEARQDTHTLSTETRRSGLGVGGGLVGSQTTTVTDFTGTNVGSTLSVGGNAIIDSAGGIVVQGSDVDIGGDARLDGSEGIAILDGLDERRTDTRVETSTFLKIGGESGTRTSAGTQGQAAQAGAQATGGGSLKLWEGSTTVSQTGSRTSVGSNLNVGGNLDMSSDGTVTVQGSNVTAGGDLSVDAENLDVLTGRNETWSESDTTRRSIGIYVESKASASAQADGTGMGAGAQAGTSATATAGMRREHEQSSDYSLTNVGSSLSAGGDMNLRARDTATFQGADVSSGGDMNIEATDIRNVAAQDIQRSSGSSSRETMGLYVGGEAKASAELNQGTHVGGGGAGASAEASAGLRYARDDAARDSESVTQVTNTFTAGGNFNRTASDTIVDQGTQVTAGGDISQSARVIRDEAVHDTQQSSSSTQSHDARIGVYAGAGASTDSAPEAGVGLKGSYEGSASADDSQRSTAVTSRFQAGGNIESRSEDETVLTGTQFQAGGDIDIDAGRLDMRAARDDSSQSSSSQSLEAELKISSGGGEASAAAGRRTHDASESSARGGSLEAGGNINIRSRDDARLEGTDMSAGGDIDIGAGGRVDFVDTQNTRSQSSTSVSAGFSLSTGGGGEGGGDDAGGGRGGIAAGASGSQSTTTQTGERSAGGEIRIREGAAD